MSPETGKRLIGDCCVVVRTDGTVEVKQLSKAENVFTDAKGFIGCRFLDHVRVQEVIKSVANIEFLVNDEGYPQWGNDQTKVNQIATFIYNGGGTPDHYILGDAVFCLSVYDEEEGWDFIGMYEELATHIASEITNTVLPKAMEICPIPEVVPDPIVKITSYDSVEDVVKAIQGDKTVKPSSVAIISGKEPHAEKED